MASRLAFALIRTAITFSFCPIVFACGDDSQPKRETTAASSSAVAAALRLSRARRPIEFNPAGEAVRARDDWLSESAECARCHETVYDNWHASRHRVAFTNPIYKESHARENSVWCLNCHAPLMRPGGDPRAIADRLQANEGVSCIVCHARDGKMIAARIPPPQEPRGALAHDYVAIPGFSTENLCADCHQFNFLTRATSNPGRAHGFEYSGLVMQNTVGEWRRSGFFDKTDCGGCHVFAGTADSHSFPGGHSLSDLGQALKIEAEYVSGRELRVTVFSLGIGHRFPTGDLFRTLRVRLLATSGRPVTELVLRRTWALPEGAARRDPNAPARRLVEDTTIPPPEAGAHAASRSFYVTTPEIFATLRYEMYMDYLEEASHLMTRLPLSITRPLIKKGRLDVKNFNSSGPVG